MYTRTCCDHRQSNHSYNISPATAFGWARKSNPMQRLCCSYGQSFLTGPNQTVLVGEGGLIRTPSTFCTIIPQSVKICHAILMTFFFEVFRISLRLGPFCVCTPISRYPPGKVGARVLNSTTVYTVGSYLSIFMEVVNNYNEQFLWELFLKQSCQILAAKSRTSSSRCLYTRIWPKICIFPKLGCIHLIHALAVKITQYTSQLHSGRPLKPWV